MRGSEPNGGMTATFTIEKRINLDALVGQVFAYVANSQYTPENYTNIFEVQDLRRLPNGGYACWQIHASRPDRRNE